MFFIPEYDGQGKILRANWRTVFAQLKKAAAVAGGRWRFLAGFYFTPARRRSRHDDGHGVAGLGLAGEPGSAKGKELLRAAHSVYQPNKIVLGNSGAVEPFARTLAAKGEATVYVCTGTACQPPTGDAVKLKELLG